MRLFAYVMREYFKYVIGAVALSIFLFILFDFIHKTTRYFVRYKPPADLIVKFYFYQLPTQLVQALPIASLLASVVCMVLLSRTNEITAMRAAGMGPFRIGMPLALGGIVVSLTAFFLGEYVLPKTAEKMRFVQQVQIEGEPSVEIAEGARWVRSDNKLFNFYDYDPLQRVLTRVRLIELRSNFRPFSTIEAETAQHDEASNTWRLSNVSVVNFAANGNVESTEQKPSDVMALPVAPEKLKKERRASNEMALGELREVLRQGENSGAPLLETKVDYHVKIAFPFAAFVVSLVGLRFGYKSERTTETAKGVLIAFALGMSYWFILNSGSAMSKRGMLPPIIGAWLANFVILAVALTDLWRSRKA